MAGRHQVLIVEDDKATADDLADVLRSIGCDCLAVASYQEALQALRQTSFCMILLDLQIKFASDAIKGHVEHGKALLRGIRQMHGDHSGLPFWLPVLIVSGFASEVPAAVEVMKDGASDVIQKPLSGHEISDKVRRALEASGRLTHDRCGERPRQHVANPSGEIVVSIPGDRVRRRTRIMIGRTGLDLTDSLLRLLLHLIVAHGAGGGVHKTDLGANAEQGFKGISNLRNELKPALGPDVDIIANDYHGTYSLTAGVKIGSCDIQKLRAIGDATISELADRLAKQLEAPPKV
jgi:FixJ family two-component response regulator